MKAPTALIVAAVVAVAGVSACGSQNDSASAPANTLVIAMTAAQLPGLDAGAFESEGWEGERFVGQTLYDGLTKLELDQGETGPAIGPGLATSWSVSEDVQHWTFELRPDVKFHDGTAWDADAAIFGFDRILNPDAEFYDADNAGGFGFFAQAIASYRKVGPMTIEITTKYPYALLPQDLPLIGFPSPAAVRAVGNDAFGENPVGTGPFAFSTFIDGGSVEFVRNDDYWGGAPKLERLVLRPIPDATARVAALRSGEVNWVEFPSTDDATALLEEGYQVLTNPYSHIWPWIFDVTKGPLADPRVRLALNLAIDRNVISDQILSGFGAPAEQYVPRPDPGYTPAGNVLVTNVSKAKELLAAAGYPDGFSMTVAYPPGGSGNMEPQPIMEALQSQLAGVGVEVSILPVEWATLLSDWANGKMSPGADAMVVSQGFTPQIAWGLLFGTGNTYNVGQYSNPAFDTLWERAKITVDDQVRAGIITEMNSHLTQDNPWLVVVSDQNPRVLAPDVHGFIQPKSVWLDLTDVTVGQDA